MEKWELHELNRRKLSQFGREVRSTSRPKPRPKHCRPIGRDSATGSVVTPTEPLDRIGPGNPSQFRIFAHSTQTIGSSPRGPPKVIWAYYEIAKRAFTLLISNNIYIVFNLILLKLLPSFHYVCPIFLFENSKIDFLSV